MSKRNPKGFQQEQSEPRTLSTRALRRMANKRKFNPQAVLKGNFTGNASLPYTLTSTESENGGLCIGYGYYCLSLQFTFILRDEIGNILRQGVFEIARTITSQKNHKGENQADVQVAYTKDCMNENAITKLVNELVSLIFSENPANALKVGCEYTTEFMRKQRMQVSTSPITREACDYITAEMHSLFRKCTDIAANKTGLFYLILLVLLIPAVGAYVYRHKINDCIQKCCGMFNGQRRAADRDGGAPYGNQNGDMRLPQVASSV